MRIRSRGFALLVGAALALGSRVGWGQGTAVSGEVEQAGIASPREMLQFTKDALTEMEEASRAVGRLLETAVKEGDEEKIQCLRSKMASVKALTEVSAQAQGSMQEALAQGANERAQHELRKVAVALAKVRQFMAEAEACLGKAGAVPGTTQVEVTGEMEEGEEETEPMSPLAEFIAIDPPHTSPFE